MMLYKGTLEIGGKKFNVSDVDAVDKGVDVYFKGKADGDVENGAKGGVLTLHNEGAVASAVIKNCVITKGGTSFEGYGQE